MVPSTQQLILLSVALDQSPRRLATALTRRYILQERIKPLPVALVIILCSHWPPLLRRALSSNRLPPLTRPVRHLDLLRRIGNVFHNSIYSGTVSIKGCLLCRVVAINPSSISLQDRAESNDALEKNVKDYVDKLMERWASIKGFF